MTETPSPASETSASPALPSSRLGRFALGMKVPWNGFQHLVRYPALWRFAVIPLVLNLIITAAILLALVTLVWFLASWLHPWFAEQRAQAFGWIWFLVEIAIWALALLACVVVIPTLWKLLNGLLCGYFHGVLAEHVERQQGTPGETMKSISWGQHWMDTAISLGLIFFAGCFFVLLEVIPIIGGLAAICLSTLFAWWMLGLDFLSHPLALRGVRRMDQFQYARQHWETTTGLGCSIFLCQFIPLFGALMLVSAVVGAVLTYHRLESSPQ